VNLGAAYAYTGGKDFDASLPCVVFVHGALHDHSVWTLVARWFAHHGRSVLAVDLPGHGRSEGPPLASVEAMADWLLGVLDSAGVPRAALVGHSMGSLVALQAAAQRPAACERLVLVATAFPMAVSPKLLESARTTTARAVADVNVFSHASIASKPSFPGPGAWLHGANRALMHRMLAGAQTPQGEDNLFVVDFRACDAYRSGLEAASRVTAPATLVLGRNDRMTSPAATAGLASTLRADTVLLDAGHALMTEAPEPFLAALRAALPVPQLPPAANGG
jgi:pimeloyl-ACP methyl ester carboxylesterase